MKRPITDLIRTMLSRGCPLDIALEAAERMEDAVAAVATSNSDRIEEHRKREREKKAAQRARKRQSVPDLSPGHVPGHEVRDTVSKGIDIYKDSKKESEVIVPGTSRDATPETASPAQKDDWPNDYVEQFWGQYPPQRRTEKAKVVKKLALLRKNKTVTWAKLMEGLARYGASREVANGYAKGPMPWLNGGCWDDVREAAPAQNRNTGPGGRKSLTDIKRESEERLRKMENRGGLFEYDHEIDL